MSFLKKIFDKITLDDDKYGKGHRLGDREEEERRRRERERAAGAEEAHRPKTSSQVRPHGNQAAQAAGQAALARIQQQQQPKVKPVTAVQRQISDQISEENRRLEEAQRLKEHYFGTSHEQKIEASAHMTAQKIQIQFKCPALLGEGVSLPRAELEEHILDQLMHNLNDEPILTALTLLYTANYKNDEKLQKCLETLNKIVENIAANPNEEKYRKIRCENASLKEKILSCKYSELVLTVIGFKLLKVKKQDTDEQEDVYVFDHEDVKNYEKLIELKEGMKIAQPIKPSLDRSAQLFQIKNLSQNDANSFNLSDDFYNLNINEIKREQKLREEALEKAGVLRTKAMRERDEVLALRKYNYCLIRVKFSDTVFLQMVFKSNETLKDLYVCVQECLKDETQSFELSNYVLKPQQQNLSQTFAECALAPAALLHFRGASNGLELFKEHLYFDMCSSFA